MILCQDFQEYQYLSPSVSALTHLLVPRTCPVSGKLSLYRSFSLVPIIHWPENLYGDFGSQTQNGVKKSAGKQVKYSHTGF